MEQIEFVKSDLITSRIGLGTWAMGGWMWGGTDEATAAHGCHRSLSSALAGL